ncbi:LAMI_0D08174g1_1 [Lachancea mirantina]|uniref:LAMI_0D08174g1_1 n=1 Tax=Lachancea mirantina TaxID=1230905 RepID=A0A1G4JCR9_9SACH|nr:LAMI_0D08174g1_1 [Lachancea mirantina]
MAARDSRRERHLMSLPVSIRPFIDKDFIHDWTSSILIDIAQDKYDVLTFDAYFWFFVKPHQNGIINLKELEALLQKAVPEHVQELAVMMKKFENIILSDYLGLISLHDKTEVKAILNNKLFQLASHNSDEYDAELDSKLLVIPRSEILACNRQHCFDFLRGKLSPFVDGDHQYILQLRIMGLLFADDPHPLSMRLLCRKLKSDLGSEARGFVLSLQRYITEREAT